MIAEIPQLRPNGGWDERVLVFDCGETVTAFAVLSQRYTVLVDVFYTCYQAAAMARLALDEAARLHGGEAPPLLVLNTHSDWDHAWGNGAFAGPEPLLPAPVWASCECAEMLLSAEARAELAQLSGAEPERYDGAHLVAPTHTFSGEALIEGGDLSLRLLPAPGHQRGQCIVWLPEIFTLLGADALESPIPFIEGFASLPDSDDLRLLCSSVADEAALWAQRWLDMDSTMRRCAGLDARWVLVCHNAKGDRQVLAHNLAYFGRVAKAVLESLFSDVADWGRAQKAYAEFEAESAQGLTASQRDFYRVAHRAAWVAAWAWGGRAYG